MRSFRRIFVPAFVDKCVKEEVGIVPDMSVEGLSIDSVKAAIKNLVFPKQSIKPKLGRWAVGCPAALTKKYT